MKTPSSSELYLSPQFSHSFFQSLSQHSVGALSEFLAKTSTLQHLTLRGLGMTDEAFDKIVRDGIGTLTLSLKLMN